MAAVFQATADLGARALASSSALDLLVCGCVGTLMTFTAAYRFVTRSLDWGPSDT